MDRVLENSEFALGIGRMKDVCVAAGVESRKQAALVLSSGSGYGPSKLGIMAPSTNAMHASIWAFDGRDSHLISD